MNLIDLLKQPFKHSAAEMSDAFERRYFPNMIDLRPTRSGRMIVLESLLKNSTVWKCASVHMNSLGVLPRKVYKVMPNGFRDELKRNDPRQRLMRRPNKEQTKFDQDSFLTLQKLLYGTAFAEQIRIGPEQPRDLFKVSEHWVLQSKWMSVARDPKSKELIWKYQVPGQPPRFFFSWELHIRRNPSLDGVVGLSVFELAADGFSLAQALEEYGSRVFENDSTPRGVLQTKSKLGPEAKKAIREEWDAKMKGLENRGKIGILDYELEFKAIGMNNDVAQFLESRKFQREEIANWFNVPQHMAGNLDRSTNNNIEQQSKEFIRDTLGPILKATEEELNRDILTEDELDTMYVEYTIEALQRGDFGDQTENYAKQLETGQLNLNEVRKMKNKSYVEGGDEHNKPLNWGVVGQDNQPQDPQKPPQNDPKKPEKPPQKQQKQAQIADFMPILEDSWRRIATKEYLKLEKEQKQGNDLQKWAAGYYPEAGEFIRTVLTPALDTIRSVTGEFSKAAQEQALEQLIAEYEAEGHKSLANLTELKPLWLNVRTLSMSETTIQLLEFKSYGTGTDI